MHTANSFTQDISLFRVSADGSDLTFVSKTPLPSTGVAFSMGIDATDRYLYVLGNHADPDGPRPQEVNPDGTVGPPNPADGNLVEAYRIGAGGALKHISTTALPVRSSQLPYGMAALQAP